MSTMRFLAPSLVACAAVLAQAQTSTPTKVGVIQIQQAIVSTNEGQKVFGELQTSFEPKSKELEARRTAIASLQQELSKGSNTMAEEKRAALTRDIDKRTTTLNRDAQDAQEEWEQGQNKLLNELGQKMMVVVEKYARDNGFAVILDISTQQTPVLFWANGIEITKEIIDLYNKNSPVAAQATAPGKLPSSPLTAPAKPPSPPPATKKSPGTIK